MLFSSNYFAFVIYFQSCSKKNPFQVKLIILVDIKAKRFEECDHLRIAAASVSNISERMHKLCC